MFEYRLKLALFEQLIISSKLHVIVVFLQAQKRDCLLRLMICHMLGYDVSFAYIHAVKLTQQGSVLEKRVGTIGLTSFFEIGY